MSVLNTLPAPIVQMGLVEKIVDQQQNQPHALLQAGQEASRELLKAEGQRIAGTEPSNRSRKVRDRGERQGGGQQDAAGRKSAGSNAGQDSAEQDPFDNNEPGPAGSNPWAGNIVNVKI
ncbi:MAG: hypothetical protein FWG04_01480 [Desulfovibrionaceae bacterium]|nr:hypothetical protein [Desulfovibrionaceae bacterium]